ncbi:c-type cytochrome [Aestuariivirga sp.]|jgi:mono/diheme cytochrome c family protein|uniref:c-type cytochrome n=1 Tax=Aestuariivirga sp. TaxID=2650926 RepID=UPI003784A8D3
MVKSRISAVILALALAAGSAQAADVSNGLISGEADFKMYCASCHGETGKGDGPKSFGLSTPAPDLTTLTARYGAFPRERLAELVDGRAPLAGHGTREMPVWGVWFKEEAADGLGGAEGDDSTVARRVANLIDYIATLQGLN